MPFWISPKLLGVTNGAVIIINLWISPVFLSKCNLLLFAFQCWIKSDKINSQVFAKEKHSVTNIWLCVQWVRVVLIKFSQLKLEGDLASISCAVSRQSIPAILAICISARGLNLFLTFSICCLGERLRNGKSKQLVWFWMETFKKQLSF